MRKILVGAGAALAIGVSVTACGGGGTNAQNQDAARSQASVDRMITKQPVASGNYSPTREQINNWVKTWESAPGKLAYVYLFHLGSNEPMGYYILKGPPVSYAAHATQPTQLNCPDSSRSCVAQNKPAEDGAFYGDGGGSNQYYGMDATTGRELEWGGTGISYLLSDKPLRLTAPPLGDAVIKK